MAGGISPQLGVYWLLFLDPPTFTESLFFLSTHSEPHTQGMGTDLGPESLGGTCARGIEQQDEEPHSGAVSGKPLLKKSMHAKSCKSCPALCDPEDSSPPGSSVQAILQARLLEWVVVPSSRGSFQPRDQPSSPVSPALQADSLPLVPLRKPLSNRFKKINKYIINRLAHGCRNCCPQGQVGPEETPGQEGGCGAQTPAGALIALLTS